MNRTFILLLWILYFLGACEQNNLPDDVQAVLRSAGNNAKELQAVTDHYQAPEDSLKLKAAYFLIGNMSNKYFHPYNESQQRLIHYIDSSLNKLDSLKPTLDHDEYRRLSNGIYGSLEPKWKDLKRRYGNHRTGPVRDMDMITSEVLIENIDYAFKVWEKVPWSSRYTFDQFCEYVLPYRTVYDIPGFWRKKRIEEYSWVLDSIKNSDFLYACKLINDSLHLRWNNVLLEFSHMSVSDMDIINRGVCRQHSSMKIAALRAIGIPSATVTGVQSTSWVIVPDKNGKFVGWEAHEAPEEGDPYIDDRRYRNYAKVFRSTYKIQSFLFSDVARSDVPPPFFHLDRKDITGGHTDAMDVSLKLSIPAPDETDYAFLCIFDRKKSKRWKAVHWSNINKNREAYFDQMGLGCIYLPAYYHEGQYYPAGNPIYLDKEGVVFNLESNVNNKETVKIYRKFHLNYWENRHADWMINDVFEGSNREDFKNAQTLFTINSKPLRMEEGQTITDQKFRYVRYRSVPSKLAWHNRFNDNLKVAEIAFYGEHDHRLKGRTIASSKTHLENSKNAFDNDIRTNFNSRELCWIGLDLGKPTKITKVKYLFRNAFNTVEPGDTYELFYWEKEWKSLGTQLATSDYVEYDVPKNAVLWLRNLTKGKEEHIFFIKDGKQIWG